MTFQPKESTKFWFRAAMSGLALSWRSMTPFVNMMWRLFWFDNLSFFSVSRYASTFHRTNHKRRYILWNTEKAQRAIQNKRCKMLTWEVLLLRDNARPHTAARIQNLVDSFRWDVLPWSCTERLSLVPAPKATPWRQALQKHWRGESGCIKMTKIADSRILWLKAY